MDLFRKATASLGNVLPAQVTNLVSEDKKKEAKKILREKLLPLVQKINPGLAEKITDSLLEKDPVEVHSLVTDQEKLQKVVNEEAKKLGAESSTAGTDPEATASAQAGIAACQISESLTSRESESCLKVEESAKEKFVAAADTLSEKVDKIQEAGEQKIDELKKSCNVRVEGIHGGVTESIENVAEKIGTVTSRIQEAVLKPGADDAERDVKEKSEE